MARFAYFLGALLVFLAPGLKASGQEKKVEVESPYTYEKTKNGKLRRVQYRDRRPKWGTRLTLAVGAGFETQVEKTHPVDSTVAVLESDGTPIQFDIGITRNYEYFSVGPELGYFSSKIINICGHPITFRSPSLGVGLYLDGLFKSAYFVPFLSVGALLYPDIKTEKRVINTCTLTGEKGEVGSEDFVMYYRAGFLLSLNWLDKGLAGGALSEYGLQNSFLYFAVRQIPTTSKTDAADLGTTAYLEYGLQLEF